MQLTPIQGPHDLRTRPSFPIMVAENFSKSHIKKFFSGFEKGNFAETLANVGKYPVGTSFVMNKENQTFASRIILLLFVKSDSYTASNGYQDFRKISSSRRNRKRMLRSLRKLLQKLHRRALCFSAA